MSDNEAGENYAKTEPAGTSDLKIFLRADLPVVANSNTFFCFQQDLVLTDSESYIRCTTGWSHCGNAMVILCV